MFKSVLNITLVVCAGSSRSKAISTTIKAIFHSTESVTAMLLDRIYSTYYMLLVQNPEPTQIAAVDRSSKATDPHQERPAAANKHIVIVCSS